MERLLSTSWAPAGPFYGMFLSLMLDTESKGTAEVGYE